MAGESSEHENLESSALVSLQDARRTEEEEGFNPSSEVLYCSV